MLIFRYLPTDTIYFSLNIYFTKELNLGFLILWEAFI